MTYLILIAFLLICTFVIFSRFYFPKKIFHPLSKYVEIKHNSPRRFGIQRKILANYKNTSVNLYEQKMRYGNAYYIQFPLKISSENKVHWYQPLREYPKLGRFFFLVTGDRLISYYLSSSKHSGMVGIKLGPYSNPELEVPVEELMDEFVEIVSDFSIDSHAAYGKWSQSRKKNGLSNLSTSHWAQIFALCAIVLMISLFITWSGPHKLDTI